MKVNLTTCYLQSLYVIGSEKTTLMAQNKKTYFLSTAKFTSALAILLFVSGA